MKRKLLYLCLSTMALFAASCDKDPMGGKTKSAKRCVMVNGVIFSGLQGVLRAIFGTLKT